MVGFTEAVVPRENAPNLVLFVVHFGHALVLARDVDYHVENFLNDGGVSSTTEMWSMDGVLDFKRFGSESGPFIGKLKWESQGLSDWPGGGLEYGLALDDVRPATEEEWKEHVSGNWPWDYDATTDKETGHGDSKEKE